MEIPPSSFYGKRCFERLEEVDNELSNDIYRNFSEIPLNIIPPIPDILTDEEEFDDDDVRNDQFPKDVPGYIEVQVPSDFSDDDDVPLNVLAENIRNQALKKHRRRKSLSPLPDNNSNAVQTNSSSEISYTSVQEPKWVRNEPNFRSFDSNGSIDSVYTEHYLSMINEITNLNPTQVFEKLFGQDLFQLIAEQSMIYAAQKNFHSFTVSANEVRTFIGIMILTGYVNLPQERMYWSSDEDLGIPSVQKAMSRDRFLQIKRFLHLADNSKINNSTDRMYKLRPLINALINKFSQWGIFHKDLSIDESMVKYYGGHPVKQFIKGKPVRFGYKNWVLSSSTGYCYNFDVYCGKEDDSRKIPLGASIVLKFVNKIPRPENHTVFFDNYFSTHSLFASLKNKGIRATGTIRENRTQKCPLTSNKVFAKNERGFYDWRYDSNNELICVRWKDNSVCTMMSNYDAIEPIQKIKRWSKVDKKKIDIEQPHLFSTYNSGMGGVDLMDQAISNYRICIRGKKWWWVLFTYMVDLSISNAWKLHSLCNENKMPLLLFRRHIARTYLRESTRQLKKRGPPSSTLTGLQFDGSGHFPQKLSKQLRCCCCSARIRWQCKKCQKTLCIEKSCFEVFHTQVG